MPPITIHVTRQWLRRLARCVAVVILATVAFAVRPDAASAYFTVSCGGAQGTGVNGPGQGGLILTRVQEPRWYYAKIWFQDRAEGVWGATDWIYVPANDPGFTVVTIGGGGGIGSSVIVNYPGGHYLAFYETRAYLNGNQWDLSQSGWMQIEQTTAYPFYQRVYLAGYWCQT